MYANYKNFCERIWYSRLILLLFRIQRGGENYTPYIWQSINGPYSNTPHVPPFNYVSLHRQCLWDPSIHVAHNNTPYPPQKNNNKNNVKCSDSILWPNIYVYVYCHSTDPNFSPLSKGTYQVRNEINENKTKPPKAKRSQRKQNEIDWYEQNGRKTNNKRN